MASGDGIGTVNVTHPKNGKCLKSFVVSDSSVESVSISHGKPAYLASGTMDGLLLIHDLATGMQLHKFEHERGLVQVQWHPSKKIVYTCSLDGTVRVWNIVDGSSTVLTGHKVRPLCHCIGFCLSILMLQG